MQTSALACRGGHQYSFLSYGGRVATAFGGHYCTSLLYLCSTSSTHLGGISVPDGTCDGWRHVRLAHHPSRCWHWPENNGFGARGHQNTNKSRKAGPNHADNSVSRTFGALTGQDRSMPWLHASRYPCHGSMGFNLRTRINYVSSAMPFWRGKWLSTARHLLDSLSQYAYLRLYQIYAVHFASIRL
jgi:hypothetical protein